MITSVFNNIKIAGIQTAVPTKVDKIVDVYSEKFGAESVKQFCETTGVVERHRTSDNQTSSDFAFVAADSLLNKKNVDRKDVEICIYITQTPDYRVPATACVLHKRLGLSKDCICFDMNLGCSGYVYGLQIVSSLMKNIDARYALLLVGDTSTLDFSSDDKSAVMLFGDSGAATLLEKVEQADVMRTTYRTDGNGFKAIIKPAGEFRNRGVKDEKVLWPCDGCMRSDYNTFMNGIDVFTFTITEVPKLIKEFVAKYQLNLDDYDDFVFHQANVFILKQLMKKFKLPKEKVPISMDRYGNTSVTSIPLTLCDKYGNQNVGKKKIFACGFGIGLSWGITTFEIDTADIYPIIETDDYFKDGAVSHD